MSDLDDARIGFLRGLRQQAVGGFLAALKKRALDLVKKRLIAEYIKTPTGRATLAASMTAPLRQRLNYAAVAAQMFSVQPMPSPAPSIDLDELKKRRFGESPQPPDGYDDWLFAPEEAPRG